MGKSSFILGLALAVLAPVRSLADTANTEKRSVTQLAAGIYEIRHKDAPDTNPQGNTVVICVQGKRFDADQVREIVARQIDIEALRRQFDGGVQENMSQSNTIGRCLVRNAYYEEVLR
jgi:hypothetical protein